MLCGTIWQIIFWAVWHAYHLLLLAEPIHTPQHSLHPMQDIAVFRYISILSMHFHHIACKHLKYPSAIQRRKLYMMCSTFVISVCCSTVSHTAIASLPLILYLGSLYCCVWLTKHTHRSSELRNKQSLCSWKNFVKWKFDTLWLIASLLHKFYMPVCGP